MRSLFFCLQNLLSTQMIAAHVVLRTIALLRLNKHVSYEHLLCIHNDTHTNSHFICFFFFQMCDIQRCIYSVLCILFFVFCFLQMCTFDFFFSHIFDQTDGVFRRWLLCVSAKCDAASKKGRECLQLVVTGFYYQYFFYVFICVDFFFRLAAEIFISNSFSVLVSVLKSKYTGIERERKGKE